MKLTPTKRNLKELSDAKRSKRRQELISTVQRGLDMTGAALQELRDEDHWKDTGHTTFAAFCKDTFTISKTKLYTILKGMEVVASLPKNLQPLITNDAQALALAKLPKNKRADAISKAEKNGGVTAENLCLHGGQNTPKTNVTNEVTKFRIRNSPVSDSQRVTNENSKTPLSKKDTKVLYDEIGIPIPDDAIPYWNRRQEVQDILTQITKLKSVVVGGREAQDCQWLKVTNSIANTFDSLRSLISEAKPYAVCTTCQGVPSLQPEGCNFCKNTGLISRWQWDTQSRQEVKDIVMRRAADLKKEREHVH